MKKKATFSREQLSKSKTFGYGKDLVLAVLEDRDYTKDEAEKFNRCIRSQCTHCDSNICP